VCVCVCCFVLLTRYWGIVTVPGSIPFGSVKMQIYRVNFLYVGAFSRLSLGVGIVYLLSLAARCLCIVPVEEVSNPLAVFFFAFCLLAFVCGFTQQRASSSGFVEELRCVGNSTVRERVEIGRHTHTHTNWQAHIYTLWQANLPQFC